MKVLDQKSGENWVLYNGDSCEILAGIPTASIHYSITSIPFASLYTYSNSERDLGNSRNYGEFAELYRGERFPRRCDSMDAGLRFYISQRSVHMEKSRCRNAAHKGSRPPA